MNNLRSFINSDFLNLIAGHQLVEIPTGFRQFDVDPVCGSGQRDHVLASLNTFIGDQWGGRVAKQPSQQVPIVDFTRRNGLLYERQVGVFQSVDHVHGHVDRPICIHIDTKLRDEVVERFESLDRPSYRGYVMPQLTPKRDDAGNITDVTISYPLDLETQMLEWSGRR